MRVLHIISTVNIGSGIANFAMNYYRKIVGFGVQFDFLAFNTVEKGFEREIEELGGRVFYIPQPTLTTVSKYKKALKQFFTAHACEWECVHIHEILVQKYISKCARKYGRVNKLLIHSHVTKFILPNDTVSPFKNFVQMQIKKIRNAFLLHGRKRNADLFLGCSKDAGLALFGRKIVSGDRYFTVKNAIEKEAYAFNTDIRAQYRREMGLEDKKVILVVGRLCEQKNQTFMLEVFKEIKKIDSSYALLLVGDGHLRQLLNDKVSALGLDDGVIFTGNRTDVANIMQCADIFILPSLTEGLGIVAVEAQAAGLPCIVSTGVPQFAQISPHFEFIALNKGAKYWADRVLNTQLERYDNSEFVISSGYDISSNVKMLADIYKM